MEVFDSVFAEWDFGDVKWIIGRRDDRFYVVGGGDRELRGFEFSLAAVGQNRSAADNVDSGSQERIQRGGRVAAAYRAEKRAFIAAQDQKAPTRVYFIVGNVGDYAAKDYVFVVEGYVVEGCCGGTYAWRHFAFGQISGMLTDLIQVVDVNMNYSRGADGMSDRVDFNLSKDYGRIVVNANAGFSGRNEMNMNENEAIIGDAYVEYKMTENFRVRVFNRSNANDFTKYNIAPYTQGVGLFYHRQYDSFKDMFTRKKKNVTKNKKKRKSKSFAAEKCAQEKQKNS